MPLQLNSDTRAVFAARMLNCRAAVSNASAQEVAYLLPQQS